MNGYHPIALFTEPSGCLPHVRAAAPGLFVTIIKRMIGRARPLVTGFADR